MNSKKMIKSLPGCFQEYGGVSDKKKERKKRHIARRWVRNPTFCNYSSGLDEWKIGAQWKRTFFYDDSSSDKNHASLKKWCPFQF